LPSCFSFLLFVCLCAREFRSVQGQKNTQTHSNAPLQFFHTHTVEHENLLSCFCCQPSLEKCVQVFEFVAKSVCSFKQLDLRDLLTILLFYIFRYIFNLYIFLFYIYFYCICIFIKSSICNVDFVVVPRRVQNCLLSAFYVCVCVCLRDEGVISG